MSLEDEMAKTLSKPAEYDAFVSPKLDDILKTDVALKALITSSNAISTSNIPINMNNNTLVQNWVWIKTNTSSMYDFTYGDKPVEEEVKNGYAVFLSVKTYTKEQTAMIQTELNDASNNNIKKCPIIISSYGTINIKSKNKTIPNENNPLSGKETDNYNSGPDENYYVSNTLSWDSNNVISNDLKYILWFNENLKLYHLLYNPIHRVGFNFLNGIITSNCAVIFSTYS